MRRSLTVALAGGEPLTPFVVGVEGRDDEDDGDDDEKKLHKDGYQGNEETEAGAGFRDSGTSGSGVMFP